MEELHLRVWKDNLDNDIQGRIRFGKNWLKIIFTVCRFWSSLSSPPTLELSIDKIDQFNSIYYNSSFTMLVC